MVATTYVNEPTLIVRWTSWKSRSICDLRWLVGSVTLRWIISMTRNGGGWWMKRDGSETTSPLQSQPSLHSLSSIPCRDKSKKLTLLRLFLYGHFQFSVYVFGSQGGGPPWVELRSIFWRRYHSERRLDPRISKLWLPHSYRQRKYSLLQWHPQMVSIWQYSGILIIQH